jgi:hypothetical protein
MRVADAVLGAWALLAAAQGMAAQPAAVLQLEPYRKSVAMRVDAHGHKGLFTLDTAGGITLVSPEFAKAAGCKPWGQIVGFRMGGEKLSSQRCDNFTFSVSGHPLSVPVVSVFDVAPLIANQAAPVEGSLALDAFAGQTITIDFAGGTLTVETPASAAQRVRGATQVPIHLLREIGGRALTAVVDVPTPQGPLRFELDSGNGGTLLVSKIYARLFGLDPDAQGPQKGAISLAPGIVAQGLVFTPELVIDGNLGMPFLKDWAVTLDLAEGRMWLKRSQFTPPPGMGAPPPLPQGG